MVQSLRLNIYIILFFAFFICFRAHGDKSNGGDRVIFVWKSLLAITTERYESAAFVVARTLTSRRPITRDR